MICSRDEYLCPITFLQFSNSPTASGIELHNSIAVGGIYLLTSKKTNNLPITSIKIANEPCMDALKDTQSKAFHSLEVNWRTFCPQEDNTKLSVDPRYTKSPAFKTNEYKVQDDNYILPLLVGSSCFTCERMAGNNWQSLKQNFDLGMWTRPTPNWS